jgi:hypothetical protein
VVVERGTALAGPRCIDLRPTTARSLGTGTSLAGADGRERWRIVTRASITSAPVAGWIVPAWDERVSVTALPPTDRVQFVLGHRSVITARENAEAILELAALPCLRFARPHDIEQMGPAIETLLADLPS